ncbi:MAG: DUF1512 family protein [Candidatus Hydrothermarchaeaceae archaeon]
MLIFSAIMLFILMFFSKYYMYRMIYEMEKVAATLENYVTEAVDLIVKTSKEKGGWESDPKELVENTLEFFLIPPVDLDPYGILRKIEHLLDKSEDRFEEVAARIAPKSDEVWRAHIISLLKGGVGLNMIAKIVRHYVEFVKKTGNLQIAMLFQMNMPLIKKVAKAHMRGVQAIADGRPIGDGIGPLVAANLMEGDAYGVAKDVVCNEINVDGHRAFVVKAKGPGANLGKIGDAVSKLCGDNNIGRIITIDASVKLEGEKTGKVVQGIGAAIGGFGPEKAKMEDVAVAKNIPLDAFAVKLSVEEAIAPLTKDIGKSVENAIKLIKESIGATKGDGVVLVVGVGNTCGIGNSRESVEGLELPEKEVEKEKEGFSDRMIKKLFKKPEPEKLPVKKPETEKPPVKEPETKPKLEDEKKE